MSGSKTYPLSHDNSSQASNASSQHQLSDAIKLLINSQTEVISASKTVAKPTPYAPPPYKQIITNIYDMKVDNINTGDLMKHVNVTCDSISNSLTFYRTIY